MARRSKQQKKRTRKAVFWRKLFPPLFDSKTKLSFGQRSIRFTFVASVRILAATAVLMTILAIVGLGRSGWNVLASALASDDGSIQPDPSHIVSYNYDDRGMLVGRIARDGAGVIVQDTGFLIADINPTNQPQIVAEIDHKTGKVVRDNLWGPEGLICQVEHLSSGEEIRRYPLCDVKGTVCAVRTIHPDGAEDTQHYEYTPLGDPIGPAPAIDYAFHGQWRDPDTGMQFHRARWYDPKTGQWSSVDPDFDFPGGFGNDYAYAGLNSINKIDTRGRDGDELSLLEAASMQLQLGLIRFGRYAPLVGDIAYGFLSGDPTNSPFGSLALLGAVPNDVRMMGNEAIEEFLARDGWKVVAKQIRPNGAGTDLIFKKGGGTVKYLIAEIKVSKGMEFDQLLGQPKYGWQMSPAWIDQTIAVIRSGRAEGNFSGLRWSLNPEEALFIRDNLMNGEKVEKQLFGLNILDVNKQTGMNVGNLYEMDVEFADKDISSMAEPLLLGRTQTPIVFFKSAQAEKAR